MMSKTVLLAVLGVIVCLLGGCGRDTDASANPSGPISVFRAPESTVMVKVGDRAVTVGDFRQRLSYEMGIYAFTMKNAQQQPKDPEKKLEIFEAKRIERVLPQLVHCALLDAYLDSACGGRGVTNADKVVEKAVNHLLPKKQRKLGIEGLAQTIGTTPEYFKEQALVAAREDKARLVFDPASATVSEQEVDEGLSRMAAYTAKAVASNRVTWVTASNVLARVKAGEDFEKVAKEQGPAGDEAKEWGDFSRQDLENAPALRKWAFAAKVGEIGGPFDVEDGLSIVRLMERTEGTAEESFASARTSEVTLTRINFPMIEENPEPKTREYCRASLLKWKARKAKERLFEKLMKETKLEYPNGDQLDFTK